MTGPLNALSKDEREALATAQALEESLDQLTTAMRMIVKWKQRVFRVGIACVITAAITIGVSWWNNHSATSRIHAAQVSACQNVGNTLRAGEDGVWHRFVAIATQGKPQTPAQQEIIRKLFAYVDGVFMPVNCRKLYP